jgi:hypothetical protein
MICETIGQAAVASIAAALGVCFGWFGLLVSIGIVLSMVFFHLIEKPFVRMFFNRRFDEACRQMNRG